MSRTSKSPTKRAKLEPLSVEDALSSPAAEGMFSFLNIRPEELLRPRALSDIVHAALPLPDPSGSSTSVGGLPAATSNSYPGVENNNSPGLEVNINHEPEAVVSLGVTVNSRPGSQCDNIPGVAINDSPGAELYHWPGQQDTDSPGVTIDYSPGIILIDKPAPRGEVHAQSTSSEQLSEYHDTPEAKSSSPGLEFNSSPGDTLNCNPGVEPSTRELASFPAVHTPRSYDRTSPTPMITLGAPGPTLNRGPGLQLAADQSERSLLVSEVRYTVRRARLVQDGHTSNEQKLYEYLWTHADTYDEISRRVSIGFRTLAARVRMARASAQKNLRALVQKLALEVIEGFDVTSSKAPTYRVFNYTDILRRREIAGMIWYVRRTQAVRFVDSQGREIITAYQSAPGLALTLGPGLLFDEGPGPDVGPAPGANISHAPGPELGPHYREEVFEKREAEKTSSTASSEPPLELVKQLQQTFPAIDHLAVQTLWNECRVRAGDCTVAEILHFMNRKLPIAKNGRIQNPIGFVLTSVPKCFEGETFTSFRQEEARRRQEQERREEEEREQQLQLEEQNRREAEAYRKAEETLTTLSQSDYAALYERVKGDLKRNYPQINWPNRQALEDRIRIGMIREIQKRAGV